MDANRFYKQVRWQDKWLIDVTGACSTHDAIMGCHTFLIKNINVAWNPATSTRYDDSQVQSFWIELEKDPKKFYSFVRGTVTPEWPDAIRQSILKSNRTLVFLSDAVGTRGSDIFETADFVQDCIDNGWYCVSTPVTCNQQYADCGSFVRGWILITPEPKTRKLTFIDQDKYPQIHNADKYTTLAGAGKERSERVLNTLVFKN